MDRHFLMRSDKFNKWFCGRCGKRLIPDLYNAGKHAQSCGFSCSESGRDRNVIADYDRGYRLTAEGEDLHLQICRPELVPIPGFPDRFRGIRWITVMDTVFPSGSREPEVIKNDSGADPDLWLAMIRAEKCCRIHSSTDAQIIRQVFPGIIRIYSLQMFAHIYRTKGFRHTRLLTEQEAMRLMLMSEKDALRLMLTEQEAARLMMAAAEEPSGKACNLESSGKACNVESAGKTCNVGPGGKACNLESSGKACNVEPAAKACNVEPAAKSRNTASGNNGLPALSLSPGRSNVGTPLKAVLVKGRDSSLILRVTLSGAGQEPVAFLFSRGYAACTPNADVKSVLKEKCTLDGDSEKAVRWFARACPEYHLEQYLDKSSNVLIPLIAPEYHNLLELAAKAAIPAVAENMDSLEQFEKDPFVIRNLQTAFGLPLHVLRALRPQDTTPELLEKLAEIHRSHPGLLQFDRFTPSMCSFYENMKIHMTAAGKETASGHRPSGRRYRINGLTRTDLTDAQVLQILRYLYRKNASWQYLCDYINACELLGEYPYGFLPKNSLVEAHDRVVERIGIRENDTEEFSFVRAVLSRNYQSLVTNETEEDQEFFRDDPFVIIAPRHRQDLFAESASMHNCVRIYTHRVAAGNTKIYFLRKKTAPMRSYGTIEVQGWHLIQAKGFANSRLDRQAQDFILKWCEARHLLIRTRDITVKKSRNTRTGS